MPKNIVLLSDGTGNSASKLFKTNVWRLYQALDLSECYPADSSQPKQIAYFDDGVGTAAFKLLALLGGAFGWGLKRNVLDLYIFLCRHYQEGDRIYGFGFSRGAFTIRVLTGLIANQGLIRPELSEAKFRRQAEGAFRAYRQERYERKLLTYFIRPMRNAVIWFWNKRLGRQQYDRADNRPAPGITFLGLWDTVAAYGLPVDELTQAWNCIFPLSFPDYNLSPIVNRACHALALDDERHSFHPELWNEQEGDYLKGMILWASRHQVIGPRQSENFFPPVPFVQLRLKDRLTQVWFTGMHSNVGGGYPDDGMSSLPLNWMMNEAKKNRLTFRKDEHERIKAAADINGKMYDSRKGVGGFYRYYPRKLKDFTNCDVKNAEKRVIVERPKIHESVFKRIKNQVDGYAPIGLPGKYDVVTTDGKIIDDVHRGTSTWDFLESPTRSKNRANRQEALWNLVWWKRRVYFLATVFFLLLAALPLYTCAIPEWEGEIRFLSPVIGVVGKAMPDMLNPLFRSYQNYPIPFITFLIPLIFIVVFGNSLHGKISDRMRAIWQKDGPGVLPEDWLYKVRSSRFYQWTVKRIKRPVLPGLVMLTPVFVFFFGFRIADGLGCYCTPPSQEKHQLSGTRTDFDNNTLNWASGIELQEGQTYKISITIKDLAEWKDRTIESDIMGHKNESLTFWHKLPLMLGTTLRRNYGEPWFKPIARIGRRGNDTYPLNGTVSENGKKLAATIKARRNGELFLFLNDAVLPAPASWQYFYNNNHGIAAVEVESVK